MSTKQKLDKVKIFQLQFMSLAHVIRCIYSFTAWLGTKRDFKVWTYNLDNWDWCFMHIDLKWSDCNSERMELPIWQRWFCSVGSPCITEATNWSQPLHTVEKLLFWKFGGSWLGRKIAILKIWSWRQVCDDKTLLARILVYSVWPWYSTWAIQEWQTCMQKIVRKNKS